jgi:hypothetical protein
VALAPRDYSDATGCILCRKITFMLLISLFPTCVKSLVIASVKNGKKEFGTMTLYYVSKSLAVQEDSSPVLKTLLGLE